METLGERLKKSRELKKLLQKEVAKDLDILPQTYSRYESNIRIPDIYTLKKLAVYFDVSTDYLLGIDKPYIDKNALVKLIKQLKKDIVAIEQYINNCK